MKKLALATAVLASVFAINTAQAYQGEVGATLNITDPEAGDMTTGFGVDGTYYLTPVQVKNSPLNEAAFLDHASNINGALGYASTDNYSTTDMRVGVEYFVPNTQFYVGGGLTYSNLSVDGYEDISDTYYDAQVGYLPMPNLLVAAGIAGSTGDNSTTDPVISAKYVTALASGNDINVEGAVTLGDDTAISVGGDFYLDKMTSIGIGYTDQGANDGEFSLRAKKFFNQQMSVGLEAGFGDNVNTYGIRGAYRF